jgi:hypothetical protein
MQQDAIPLHHWVEPNLLLIILKFNLFIRHLKIIIIIYSASSREKWNNELCWCKMSRHDSSLKDFQPTRVCNCSHCIKEDTRSPQGHHQHGIKMWLDWGCHVLSIEIVSFLSFMMNVIDLMQSASCPRMWVLARAGLTLCLLLNFYLCGSKKTTFAYWIPIKFITMKYTSPALACSDHHLLISLFKSLHRLFLI